MSSLEETLRSDLLDATRSRDEVRRNTLRMVIASIGNAKIQLGHELSDDDAVKVLQKEAKQRRESIEEFQKGDRQDLVEKEQAELEIIELFLPQQLSVEEIKSFAEQAIANTNAENMNDLGQVMRELMPMLEGRADGRVANQLVRELLNS
ncbi:MAG: glutamyl-tRNA amidotransferase [Chloroflexi bacterium]|nr:glutamyl-tRNA amidotransferase [Chloroflexota bacterium]|tara:strand:- start:11194 stop:11643 length:450 start_codon:yes stop_codon:yes gene_type:complete